MQNLNIPTHRCDTCIYHNIDTTNIKIPTSSTWQGLGLVTVLSTWIGGVINTNSRE